MSRKRQPLKIITRISSRFIRRFLANTKKQLIWLLRAVFGTQKRQTTATAGFVLPTVAMVSVVVILLTTAIMLRSFDRAKNASNVRVNEAVLSAATPAIDRGRAKIAKLFQDRSLPRATPTDDALYNTLIKNIDKYTFGDETKLKLEFEFNGESNIQEPTDDTPIALNKDETVKTAWRFPVDTDNNGKFDSYTLYGILFRTPPVVNVTVNGQPVSKYQRARNPLEARTPPMSTGTADANCGGTTSASLVGNTGWVRQDNELKKSFFVYTATVPITGTPPGTNYETYKGGSGFAAVEYQQDRIQIPPNNTAVIYEDDIALTPGAAFNLNGAVFTNSNFITSNTNGGAIKFYQVSSRSSCFYDAKNAKIIVGGNTGRGGFTNTSQTGSATVDLYQGKTTAVSTSSWIQSNTNAPNVTAYNNLAYARRINTLVAAQMANGIDSDPQEVKDGIEKKKTDLGLASFTTAEFDKYRRENLTRYFKIRTRRVPYTEVAFGVTETNPSPLLQTENGDPDTLRPNDIWIYPTDPTDGKTGTNYTKLTLNIGGSSLEPEATEPTELKKNSGKEGKVGDRVLVGNNLPELWWDKTKEQFVGSGLEDTQEISGVKWDLPTGTDEVRTRKSLVQTLADVGSTDRDGEWELDAAKVPSDPTEPVGGLRVVTGAGVYLPIDKTPTSSSFSTSPTTIWPDTMPVPGTAPFRQLPPNFDPRTGVITASSTRPTPPLGRTDKPYWMYAYMGTNAQTIAGITYRWPDVNDTTDAVANTPYLKMRATAVYHYKSAGYDPTNPQPIACVSSYYVPTNSIYAKNKPTFAGKTITYNTGVTTPPTPTDTNPQTGIALSNNGVVYD
ncbi:hormogonium polysaccharide biosynthesis protein HpsA [Anabaena sp. UHCC 0253]|uniref:hormogonium polysaccharide biosynthesis protein HpsA n=1 Tax=Anabaena sp. UHCC 0253 TaxID=2590019 RepID=UPI001C2C8F4D|nr:hormogonium polysaccharide biosynthesis protein HpsA [Anabaena sp. UHCC 0253]